MIFKNQNLVKEGLILTTGFGREVKYHAKEDFDMLQYCYKRLFKHLEYLT